MEKRKCYFIDVNDEQINFPIMEGFIEEENENSYYCVYDNNKRRGTFNKETMMSNEEDVYMHLIEKEAKQERIDILENYLDWGKEKVVNMLDDLEKKEDLLEVLKNDIRESN